nr:CrcB family protein [Kineococcus vitellinus]
MLALVAAGGAAGTLARWAVGVAVPAAGWPPATLLVNLGGAFALGALLEALLRRGPETAALRRWRLLLGTGFCGGFTTWSAFAVELERLLAGGRGPLALGYAAASLAGGLLAATAGAALAAALGRGRAR